MSRRHKYQFVSEQKYKVGLYGTERHYVRIRHSKYGEQDWILRETYYKRVCDGTGKEIKNGERCYSLFSYDRWPNHKARLSIEFVEQLKQQPEAML